MNLPGAFPLKLVKVVPFVMTAALVACSDGEVDQEEVGDDSAALRGREDHGPKWSPGCFTKPKAPAVTSLTVSVGGVARTALVHMPTTDRKRPKAAPVVLSFHGYNMTAGALAAFDGMDASADQNEFISVHPQALGPAWDVSGTGQVDEAGFIRALLDELGRVSCIATDRVYAAGYSNGGAMAYSLACNVADRIAAIAPIEAQSYSCSHKTNVPTIGFHGLNDRLVPYGGVPNVLAPTEDVWNAQAVNNGCALPARVEQVSTTVEKLTYKHCRVPTVFYRLQNHGHSWPGHPWNVTYEQFLAKYTQVGSPFPWVTPQQLAETLTTTNMDADATQMIWDFVSKHAGCH